MKITKKALGKWFYFYQLHVIALQHYKKNPLLCDLSLWKVLKAQYFEFCQALPRMRRKRAMPNVYHVLQNAQEWTTWSWIVHWMRLVYRVIEVSFAMWGPLVLLERKVAERYLINQRPYSSKQTWLSILDKLCMYFSG